MVDVLHYIILLMHSLQKKYPSLDVSHLFLALVLIIIMYCLILKIVFSQTVLELCNMS